MWERLGVQSGQQNSAAVRLQPAVRGDQGKRFHRSLRDEHAIEWVFVVLRQPCCSISVADSYWQRPEVVHIQLFLQFAAEFQFFEGRLDTDFPGRRGAYE